MDLDVVDGELELQALGVGGGVEILLDVRLAVGDEPRTGVLLDVDEEDVLAAVGHVGATMDVALGVHPVAESDAAEEFDGPPLEHPGADAGQHVLSGLALDHDALDAGPMEHVGQQRPGRTCTDDGDLRLHRSSMTSCANC